MNYLIRLILGLSLLTVPLTWADDLIDLDDLLDIDDLSDEVSSSGQSAEIADPFEGINRAIYGFNDFAYKELFEPFTKGYVNVVPQTARKGIGNFFNNLEFPTRFAGILLQFRFGRASQEAGKFLVNTTAGFAGFMNVAPEFDGLNPPIEDVGQAFGAWGIDHGFYIVVPFIGPSSLRDFVGRFGGRAVDPIPEPWTQIDDDGARFALQATDLINDLPDIIDVYNKITEPAIDSYAAVRDGYAQLRAARVAE